MKYLIILLFPVFLYADSYDKAGEAIARALSKKYGKVLEKRAEIFIRRTGLDEDLVKNTAILSKILVSGKVEAKTSFGRAYKIGTEYDLNNENVLVFLQIAF